MVRIGGFGRRAGIGILNLVALACPPAFAQQSRAALYSRSCAQCHEQGSQEVRAPTRSVMAAMSADEILRALESGAMAAISKNISQADKVAIAQFVSGKRVEQKRGALLNGGRFQGTAPPPARAEPPRTGWAHGLTHSRVQSGPAGANSTRTL